MKHIQLNYIVIDLWLHQKNLNSGIQSWKTKHLENK